MNRKLPVVALSIALVLGLHPLQSANASDTAKEARWAGQIVDSLLDGDAVWLSDAGGHEFLGIYTEADSNPGRAVILAHGIGVHPNWADVIYPLRVGLLEHGITTLSIQMPILANDAEEAEYAPLFPEVPARFEAALAYLQDLGYEKISIVAHSMGASMATYYVSKSDSVALESLVIIGMGGPGNAFPGNIAALAEVRVPLLDLYGSKDLAHVLDSVDFRAQEGQKLSAREYSQVRVDGANHFFQGQESALVQQVTQWLDARAGD